METALAELRERVEALERELARLKGEQAAQLQVPVCVRDEQGRPVLEIASGAAGPRLRLLDQDGGFLVTLQGIASGGDLVVHGSGGSVAAAMGAGPHGGTVSVYDVDGQLKGWVNVTEAGGHVVTRETE
jgi:hypothetical protein